jgi:chitinase
MFMRTQGLRTVLAVAAVLVAALPAHAAEKPMWVTAYYAVWSQAGGILAPNEIDFGAITHLVHFALSPLPDGSIDTTSQRNAITPEQSAAVVAAAHAAKKPVLLCVGGYSAGPGFHAAVADPTARVALEANLVKLVTDRGYDGLDVDFEPLDKADVPGFDAFVHDLRAGLTAAKPGLLMTAAAGQQPKEYAAIQDQFDQINLMTYDLSGRWIGPHTWHNSSLRDNGATMLRPGVPYPSVVARLQRFLDAGVSPAKLGIGTAFYGFVWKGASAPAADTVDADPKAVPYRTIADQYLTPSRYHWDDQADAPYLSIDASDPAQRMFISYDDERLITDKVRYVRTTGLGGIMVWELGQGYRRNQPESQRDPLLSALAAATSLPLK